MPSVNALRGVRLRCRLDEEERHYATLHCVAMTVALACAADCIVRFAAVMKTKCTTLRCT